MFLSDIYSFVKPLLGEGSDTTTDTPTFRLATRKSIGILLVMLGIIGGRYMFGDSVDCFSALPGKGLVNDPTMDEYCLTHYTYTVHYSSPLNNQTERPTTLIDGTKQVFQHYYQFVPYFIALVQIPLLFLPSYIWTCKEGRTVEHLVNGLADDQHEGIESAKWRARKQVIVSQMTKKNNYKHYFDWFFISSLLSIVCLLVIIYVTDRFLQGGFLTLGPDRLTVDPDQWKRLDAARTLFPLTAKCAILKIGASGTGEYLDLVCHLKMNHFNEFIFLFQWYWFVLVLVVVIVDQFANLLVKCFTSVRSYCLVRTLGCWWDVEVRRNVRIVTAKFGPDRWFVLKMVCDNLPRALGADLIGELAERLGGDALESVKCD